jgi:CRISPR-associated endonuclease Csn1
VRLEDLTPKVLEAMVGRDRDHVLYEALAARLTAFDGDGAKAFSEPFYKPTREGHEAPRVRAIRVYDAPSSGGTDVRGGFADNGIMARTDVFERDGKHYLVPVYLKDTATGLLPNKAVIQGKPESQWREIDESYRFLFSLYLNDPIRLVRRSGGTETAIGGYFKGTDRSSACISIEAHDSSWLRRGQGVAQGIVAFEKYTIDPLGRSVHRVRREKRRGFSDGGDKQ